MHTARRREWHRRTTLGGADLRSKAVESADLRSKAVESIRGVKRFGGERFGGGCALGMRFGRLGRNDANLAVLSQEDLLALRKLALRQFVVRHGRIAQSVNQ